MKNSIEIKEIKNLRRDLNLHLNYLMSLKKSRERSLAITKIEESIMWLGKDLRRLDDVNPYPESCNPDNDIIMPVADELKSN